MRNIGKLFLVLFLVAAFALPVYAGDIIIINELDELVDVALCYYDSAREVWINNGWIKVDHTLIARLRTVI